MKCKGTTNLNDATRSCLINRNAAPKSAAPKKPFVPKNVANAPGHSNIAREIEQKAAQYGKTDDDEASAPFNFQVTCIFTA